MPRFVQFLAGFFLVCPGLIMWGLGLLSLFGYASGIPGLILDSADRSIDPGHFYFAGISAAILAIGYAMMGTFDLLTHKRRYNIPAKHAFPCMALELLVQILGVISFSIMLSALTGFWSVKGASPWFVILFFLLGFAGCTTAIWLHRGNLVRRENGRPPTQPPSLKRDRARPRFTFPAIR